MRGTISSVTKTPSGTALMTVTMDAPITKSQCTSIVGGPVIVSNKTGDFVAVGLMETSSCGSGTTKVMRVTGLNKQLPLLPALMRG